MNKQLEPWMVAVVVGILVVLMAVAGYRKMSLSEAPAGNPPDQEQTQAAEKPGDPPSGQPNRDDPNASAEPSRSGSRAAMVMSAGSQGLDHKNRNFTVKTQSLRRLILTDTVCGEYNPAQDHRGDAYCREASIVSVFGSSPDDSVIRRSTHAKKDRLYAD